MSREEVLSLVSKSHALLLTSQFETFGVVLIEALALGKPVIATRCGGPESIVRQKDGFLIEKNNAEQLSHAMLSMIEKYDHFDSSEIRGSCILRFGREAFVMKLENLYNDACRQKP